METIAAAGAGGLALVLLIALLVSRRGRTRARTRAERLDGDLAAARQTTRTAKAGEREAVWALGEASSRLDRARAERDGAMAQVIALESRLDDLQARVAAADADLAGARRDADEARTDVARLESELAAHRRSETADQELADLRARLDRVAAELESERAAATHLHDELEARGPDDGDDSSYRERLVASEARRRDLEDRLASLSAVRSAEQRATADRIAGLERLHLQIGERDDRIDELETDLKQAAEARDEAVEEASRLQVEVVRLRGKLSEAERRLEVLEQHGAALTEARQRITELETRLEERSVPAGEVDRLRKALEAERARAERISRRSTETAPDTTYAMWDRVVRERVDAAVARDTSRLTAEVEHLRTVVAEKEARLQALTGAVPTRVAADLPPITAIKGIGVAIAGILADHGIGSVADVAALSDTDIDALAELMPIYPGRIRDDDWVGQAHKLLDPPPAADEPESSGPPPITAIKGIGPKIAAILAEHGIESVADVAALSDTDIDALAELMPVYPGRIRDDDWVGQARSFL